MFLRSLCVGQFCAERVSAVPVISLAADKRKKSTDKCWKVAFSNKKSQTSGQRTCYQWGSCFNLFFGNVPLDNLQWRTKDKNYWPYYECSSYCWKANSANNNIWVYNINSRWRCLTKPKCFLYSARGVLSICLPSRCTKVMLNLTRAEGMQIRGDVKDTDIVGRIYVKTYFWKANINCTLISTLHTNHLLNYLRWLVCKVEILVQRLH